MKSPLACRGVAVLTVVLATLVAHAQPIDRHALVTRHNPQFDRYAPDSPASVGNGGFAFTFDVTGLQTFASPLPGGIPLGTMTDWSWHRFPESRQYRYEETLRDYPANGRQVSYSTDMQSDAAKAIRSNPHRFNLARIGLRLEHRDGSLAEVADIASPTQTLHLWRGEAVSRFEFDGSPVEVRTVAHPTLDAVAVSVSSPLVQSGRAKLEVSFAYPTGAWGPGVDAEADPSAHTTRVTPTAGADRPGSTGSPERIVRIERQLDETHYTVNVQSNGVVDDHSAEHSVTISGEGAGPLEAVFDFRAEASPAATPTFQATQAASADHWRSFWESGGAIDLSESRDPRWRELERRIVLSQFVTAVNCAGQMPPQETGLVCNSWHGKAHLEMHWWHATHFAQWGRFELLERSLDWYQQILPAARRIAERQGYTGVRWPKMTGPEGVSSPSSVGELLIWQQPHPLYFAELAYRADPTDQTLDRYAEIVEQTAAFMASYAHRGAGDDHYALGPVLIPAQECYEGRSAEGVLNPAYELAYWRWSLQTANRWRERRGLEPNAEWDEVARQIAPPHVRGGVYTAIANPPYTRRHDHPSMLAALGVMPDVGLIDHATMRRTLDDVVADWDWASTWGWDYPMMAMTAARLGEPEQAIDALLLDTPKNHYLTNGHCRQDDRLPLYLPANGGTLSAAAMMAAGWDGLPADASAPGFPDDGAWSVRHEGLKPMP